MSSGGGKNKKGSKITTTTDDTTVTTSATTTTTTTVNAEAKSVSPSIKIGILLQVFKSYSKLTCVIFILLSSCFSLVQEFGRLPDSEVKSSDFMQSKEYFDVIDKVKEASADRAKVDAHILESSCNNL